MKYYFRLSDSITQAPLLASGNNDSIWPFSDRKILFQRFVTGALPAFKPMEAIQTSLSFLALNRRQRNNSCLYSYSESKIETVNGKKI